MKRNKFVEAEVDSNVALLPTLVADDYVGPNGDRGPAGYEQIVTSLRAGFPDIHFTLDELLTDGDKVVVRCAQTAVAGSPEGLLCKRAMATALLRYSYRFTMAQLAVLADLYATALEQLEPEAVPRVREAMCDATSEETQKDPAAARAVCDRLSMDF